MVNVPQSLVALLRDNQAAKDWIADFPSLADHYLQRWHCRLDGPVTAGAVAVVIPVRSPDGPAVIKLSSPHPGNADEDKALCLWDGGAAVKMIDADPAGFALLLERLTSRHLDAPTDDGISIGGSLSARLAVAATPDVKRLSDTTGGLGRTDPQRLPRRQCSPVRPGPWSSHRDDPRSQPRPDPDDAAR